MLFDVGHPHGVYRVADLSYKEEGSGIIDCLPKIDAMIDSKMNPTIIKIRCHWSEVLRAYDHVNLVYYYTTKGKIDLPFSKMTSNIYSDESSDDSIEEYQDSIYFQVES